MGTFLRKYATATATGTHIGVPMVKAGSADFAVAADWTPATGDVKISINGGAQANITTLPAYTNGQWLFQFTALELTGRSICVVVTDSATKAVEDQCLIIETFGHALAQFAVDFSDAARFGLTALPNTAAGSAGGLPTVDAAGGVNISVGAISTTTFAVNTIIPRVAVVDALTANNDKTGYALTAPERTAIANEVEAQIIDETDPERVLTAITDKIASVNPTLGELTLAAITSSVWGAIRTDHNAVGSFGEYINGGVAANAAAIGLIKDKVDQFVFTVPGRVDASASVGAVIVAGYASGQDPADRVLDAQTTSHNSAGSIGAAIIAGTVSDPWVTDLPGIYPVGSAGFRVGSYLNATAPAWFISPDNTTLSRLATTLIPGTDPNYKFTAEALSLAPVGEGGGSGGTSGTVIVDTHYGGITDRLRLLYAGQPVADAEIRAYTAADYAVGLQDSDHLRGLITTDSDGRWRSPMFLSPGDYMLVLRLPGHNHAHTAPLTVLEDL